MHASQALSVGLAQCFVSTLWQGAALAVLVGLGLRSVPGTNATTRFAIWLTAFFGLALLPLAALAPRLSAVSSAGVAVARTTAPHFHFDLDPRWAWGIALLWVCGSVYHAASLILNGFRLRTLRKTSTLADHAALDPQVQRVLAEGKGIELRLSDRVNAPCAVGFLRPAILIPGWLWSRLSTEELRQIVVHETAHLRRRDDWTNLLQKLALVAFPLNPALYWMERRLCLEREVACDDAVLATTASAAKYAACLAGLAEKRLLRRSALLAPGAWSRQPELLLRVQGILNRKRNASTRVAGQVAAGFSAVALGGIFFLGQTPQVVSFVAPQPVQYAANAPFRTDLDSYPASPNRGVFHPVSFMPQTKNTAPARLKVPVAAHRAPRRSNPHPAVARQTVVQPVMAPPAQPLYQEVGILQSPATGRTWVVLSVWRPTPAQPCHGTAANPANATSSPAPSSAASAIQTGWLLIRI